VALAPGCQRLIVTMLNPSVYNLLAMAGVVALLLALLIPAVGWMVRVISQRRGQGRGDEASDGLRSTAEPAQEERRQGLVSGRLGLLFLGVAGIVGVGMTFATVAFWAAAVWRASTWRHDMAFLVALIVVTIAGAWMLVAGIMRLARAREAETVQRIANMAIGLGHGGVAILLWLVVGPWLFRGRIHGEALPVLFLAVTFSVVAWASLLLIVRVPASVLATDAREARRRLVATGLQAAGLVGVVIAVLLVLGPNLNAVFHRNCQKRTLSNIGTLSIATQAYAHDHGAYPEAESHEELTRLLVPEYIYVLDLTDGWGWPLEYHRVDEHGQLIRSPGCDGAYEHEDPTAYEYGSFKTPDGDIVFSTASANRWPEGLMAP
jgi:hypothetical protein